MASKATEPMVSGDGRTIEVGDVVYIQAGGTAPSGTQRTSQVVVTKMTTTRVRLERGPGKSGAWRLPQQVWYTQAAARITFNWRGNDN